MNEERRGTAIRDDRLRRWAVVVLTHRYLPLLVALLAIVLALPALWVGLAIDDYYHRVVLLGVPPFRDLLGPPQDMFRFFRGDPERTMRVMDLGMFPWWTDPLIKGEFLQAMTVLTHRLDYWLWPDSPALMHAQSLLWYAALVAATAVLYRRHPRTQPDGRSRRRQPRRDRLMRMWAGEIVRGGVHAGWTVVRQHP